MPVVGLDHLDVEIGIERRRDLPGDLDQKIDAQAHIAGAHDHGMAGGGGDFRQVVL